MVWFFEFQPMFKVVSLLSFFAKPYISFLAVGQIAEETRFCNNITRLFLISYGSPASASSLLHVWSDWCNRLTRPYWTFCGTNWIHGRSLESVLTSLVIAISSVVGTADVTTAGNDSVNYSEIGIIFVMSIR